MANWSKAFEALERGLGDQVNIGGLIHQTAQINEARAYDAALMKERDRLAESRQVRADRRAHRYRMDEAEQGHKYRMHEVEAGIKSREKMHGAGISAEIKIAGMNIDARDLLEDKKISASMNELALARQWALDTAKSEAASAGVERLYDAAVARAKEEEAGLRDLYDSLGEEGLDEERRDLILDQIYDAQDRVVAAWRETGIEALSSKAHLEKSLWAIMSESIVGRINLSYSDQPEALKNIAAGLSTDPSSDTYKKAMGLIEDDILKLIKDSGIRKSPKVINTIKTQIAKSLVRTAENRETATAVPDASIDSGGSIGSLGRSEASVAIETLSGMSDDDLAAYLQIGALEAAEAMAPSGPGRLNPKQQAINAAKAKDAEYILKALMDARDKPGFGTRRDKIDDLIGRIQVILGQTSNTGGGMLNTGGGMISAVDQGISPEALAYYEPEAIEARIA